jgi:hypothetical protein
MSIGYRIVMDNKGELKVKSELGIYIRFHMDLLVRAG